MSRFLCGFIIQLFAEESSIHGKSKYRSETRFKLLTALWHQLIDIIFLWEPLIWKHMCLHYQWLTWRRSGSDFGIKLPPKIQNKKLAIEIKWQKEQFHSVSERKTYPFWLVRDASFLIFIGSYKQWSVFSQVAWSFRPQYYKQVTTYSRDTKNKF